MSSSTSTEKKNYLLPIIVMIFLFAMISFVTNLASPMGDILKFQFNVPNWMGTLGVFANFIAYAVMGYPAGNLLQKLGYKDCTYRHCYWVHRCRYTNLIRNNWKLWYISIRSFRCWFFYVSTKYSC